ncbi:hypothetical protein C8R44DRAFT_984024, partial [Mycena epipterygia]
MAVIRTAMPCPDDDSAQFGNLVTMFDDLLELSRPTFYPEAIRIQAMQIILAQIAGKQTLHLCGSIAKWEIENDELVAFLSEIVGVALFSKRGFSDERLVNAYRTTLPEDWHPWAPCIAFLAGVAQLNEETFHAVLNARFLEIILGASGAQMQWKDYDKTLETDCNAAFNILSEPPTADLAIFWVEQVNRFGSEDPPNSLMRLVESITRQKMWPMVERRLLDLHVYPILGALLPTRYPLEFSFLQRQIFTSVAPVDYLSQFDRSPPKTILSRASAIRNFLRYVGIGGDVHRETVEYLSRLSYSIQVVILTNLIQHLISQSCIDQSTVRRSMVLFTPDSPDIANIIVQFLVDVSRSLQSVVFDATLLSIVSFL